MQMCCCETTGHRTAGRKEKNRAMNYTYMLECADGSLYTGWTNCLEKRLQAHNGGRNGAKYTKAKGPVRLVYYEGYATREEAMRRECAIKKLSRKEKLRLTDFQENMEDYPEKKASR